MPGQTQRILLVEDEVLVAMLIEDMIDGMGLQHVATASRLDQALELVQNLEFDAAILDVNLAGKRSFPIADILKERGIPFVFATGYGQDGIVEDHRNVPVLGKPFRRQDLERILPVVMNGGEGEGLASEA